MSDLINTFPNNSSRNKKTNRKFKLNYKRISSLLVILIAVIFSGKFMINKIHQKISTSSGQQKIEYLKKVQDSTSASETARQNKIKNSKVAYLTFDDGPNNNTEKVLDVLKTNNIKATFFLVGKMAEENPDIIQRIYTEGHTIGNHTYSHKYTYKTQQAFLDDVNKVNTIISKAIGKEYKTAFVRIPGGSMGKKIQKEAAKQAGLKIIDWTAVNGDSETSKLTKEYELKRLKQTFGDNQYEVIIMHDVKSITAESLQSLIDYIKSQGYIFEPLSIDSPVQF